MVVTVRRSGRSWPAIAGMVGSTCLWRRASRIAPMYRDAISTTEPSEDVLWSGVMETGDVMHIRP
jgi:hypothetical protein